MKWNKIAFLQGKHSTYFQQGLAYGGVNMKICYGPLSKRHFEAKVLVVCSITSPSLVRFSFNKNQMMDIFFP
jgi:hypothetical protein